MVSLDDAVIARLESHGSSFEILVDPDLALDLKKGKEVDISEVLASEEIFKDSAKGDRASPEHIKEVLGTEDIFEAAKVIIRKGDLQLTTEQRKKILEDRRKQVISIIARNAINPQTKLPHPPARIERAMEEARVRIDIFKPAEEQVPDVLKVLRPLIPIKFEKKEVAVKIPAHYAGRGVSIVKSYGTLKKEEWQGDGSWICVLEVPAGIIEEFFNAVNQITHGDVETRIIE
ncbi:MAG TPA: ribosome assembly factor SBDS [Euryarchaeota archaeon]|nr:shwachman-Bodian-Diamond syndrome (SBDS) protein [archaeon BMS3Bbin16]HDH28462.1 ribosome assembly factor SBDS [Euryarchaeota archaeon]HDY73658.1 ribosome assembly factor SBDS [Euryarchaeota archaeon]